MSDEAALQKQSEEDAMAAEWAAALAEGWVVSVPDHEGPDGMWGAPHEPGYRVLDGLRATKTCSQEGIATNVTLCFSVNQALLAAKAGASFISPFVGRLDDISEDGMNLIQDIVTVYQNYDYRTQVLVASVRHPIHVAKAALLGADVCTIPYKVIEQLAKHPLTDAGLAKFIEDAKKIPR